jgi:predicted nucleic acid-binding protein
LVVSNSSPLIYLAALGDFDLFHTLFLEIAIPPAVFEEVVVRGSNFPVARHVLAAEGEWIHVRNLSDSSEAATLRQCGLHAGESEAVALAQELRAEALLIDDGDAIRSARDRGLNVIRTPGVYRASKERGLIPAVASKLDDLRRAGFYLREEHYRMILKRAGEL